MNKRFAYIVLATGAMFLFSCKDTPSKNHGPIVLGDSSTIVTEEDPDKLKDLVADLKPDIPPAAKDTEETKPATAATTPDTDKNTKEDKDKTTKNNAPQQQQTLPAMAGLKAEFKEVSVLIPNLNAKQSGNANLQNANGAVYTWTSGNINGNTIRLTGNITKVSQRYQSIVVLDADNTQLPLESLSNTTSWEPLKGSNNTYRITGLDASSMEYSDAGGNEIRNAVTRAAQRHRINHKKAQDLVNSVRHVRAANQKPLVVTLRSVMWKIDGKDAKGKPFSKQIRIDVPM